MPGALEGIRIVDLTNIILGPYGTMLLADQGADVIKVEAPEGDAVRHIGKPAKTPGMGPTYLYVNRNKRSLCLDLKQPAARAALLKVVGGADAFVHALRPQAIEGLGLGYEARSAKSSRTSFMSVPTASQPMVLTGNSRPTTTQSRPASGSPT